MDQFQADVKALGTKYGAYIQVNKKCNSIYFDHQGTSYRISTHHSELGELTGTNGSGYNLPQVNRVTNSRANVLKIAEAILSVQ